MAPSQARPVRLRRTARVGRVDTPSYTWCTWCTCQDARGIGLHGTWTLDVGHCRRTARPSAVVLSGFPLSAFLGGDCARAQGGAGDGGARGAGAARHPQRRGGGGAPQGGVGALARGRTAVRTHRAPHGTYYYTVRPLVSHPSLLWTPRSLHAGGARVSGCDVQRPRAALEDGVGRGLGRPPAAAQCGSTQPSSASVFAASTWPLKAAECRGVTPPSAFAWLFALSCTSVFSLT